MKPLPAALAPLATLGGSPRAQRVLAVATLSVLVTGVASIGQVRYELQQQELRALQDVAQPETPTTATPFVPDAGAAPGATPSASGAPQASGPVGTQRPGATTRPGQTAPGVEVPTVDIPRFGLKTQGVTAKQVRIGVSYNVSGCGPDGQVSALFNAATAGDPGKAYPAFVRHVNETGGIAGRELVLDVEDDGGGGSCSGKAIAAAKAMADDNKDFLAIPGLHTESDYIIGRKVPVFGGRDDPESLRKIGANGLMVTEPLQDTFRAWASFGKHALKTGANKACFVHPSSDSSGDWDTYAKVMNAEMSAVDLAFTDEIVYTNDIATAQQQATAIATRVKTQGCNQVWVASTNPIAWIFFTQAMTQAQHFPTWTFTSYTVLGDSDLAGGLMDQQQWRNAIGLSARVPLGAGHPAEGHCADVYDKYHRGDGQNGSAATQVACAQILTVAQMMRTAVATTGVLTGDSLLLGAQAMSGRFFYDAHVPLRYSFPGVKGPFRTKGFEHLTIVRWNVDDQRYDFPDFPRYWVTFGPQKSGAVDLRPAWKGYQVR